MPKRPNSFNHVQIITLILFGASSLFSVQSVYSQNVMEGGCAVHGYPVNYFTCSTNMQSWYPTTNECDTSDNYEPNLGACTGDYNQDNMVCNTTDCCVLCKKISTEESIDWGEECNVENASQCVNGTSCRNNKCLTPIRSLGYGLNCKDSSECNLFENSTLVCVNNGDSGKCTYPTKSTYCEQDSECIAVLCNPDATCAQGGQRCAGQMKCENDPNIQYDFRICDQVKDESLKGECQKCIGQQEGLWTAFGCIQGMGVAESAKTNPKNDGTQTLIESLSQLIVSVAGGLALLLMLFGAFTMSTASSNPEKFKTGQETFTSAIVGLFFILVSALVLQFIGVNILQLPGF